MAQSRRRTKGKQNKPKRTSGARALRGNFFPASTEPTNKIGRPQNNKQSRGTTTWGTDGNRAGNKKTAAEAKTQRGQRKNSTQTPKKRKQPTKQAKKQKEKKNSGDKLWPETCRAPQAGHPSIARKQTKRGRENEKKNSTEGATKPYFRQAPPTKPQGQHTKMSTTAPQSPQIPKLIRIAAWNGRYRSHMRPSPLFTRPQGSSQKTMGAH